MKKTEYIGVRIERSTLEKIDRLAKTQDRSRSWIIQTILKREVENETTK